MSHSWRRNQFAVTAASFVGFTGFTLVMPFLPLYIRQLGVVDDGEVALWTGLTLGVTPALTALCSPFWGRVADRFGHKLMVQRALVSFVITMVAMAYVTRPWHLLALRALLGLFAGYGALALSMVARSVPRDRMAQAIGLVQTGQRLGPAVGPVIGGTLAPLVGLRNSFLVAATFYVFAFFVMMFLYHEAPKSAEPDSKATQRVTFKDVLAFENFILLLVVIFGLQFVDRSFGPVLPLWIGRLGFPPERVPLISGILFSTLALSAASGHHLAGIALKRASPRVIIAASALSGAAGLSIFALGLPLWGLITAMAVLGVSIGVASTTAYTAAGAVIPPNVHGVGFGFLTSASLVGLALSPVVNGFIAARSIRAVFVGGVLALGLLAIVVRRVMVERQPVAASTPTVEEA